MKALATTSLMLAVTLIAFGLGYSGVSPHSLYADDAKTVQESPQPDTSEGDRLLREYFRLETEQITNNCLSEIKTLEDWTSSRDERRRQLFDMLGLDPQPERTDLKPVITGTIDHEEFSVENLHFQSAPGLYVTGNLYLPKNVDGPAPTILYVCGHGGVKIDGVPQGNKTHYQHHGEWFARHGYVCLTIDTIQLGEIEGIHHGTHNKGMWWWHSRGYTPAGVEAWNSIRALDYLETRPEVDAKRFGVTGRSGGGAYSWWVAALDERIKVAVPVAGITSMTNHIVDNKIEGHCDCMYMVNTYEWDFPLVASLVAPRPLLISNTDKDSIFPLDGVYDVYRKTSHIYELYGKGANVGFNIVEGPHKDTQELRVNSFVWFDRFLKKTSREFDTPAEPLYEPPQLKVFKAIPDDERVTSVQDWFVPVAQASEDPKSVAGWNELRDQWMRALQTHVFRGWPDMPPAAQQENPAGDSGSRPNVVDLDVKVVYSEVKDGVRFEEVQFASQKPYRLTMFVIHRDGKNVDGKSNSLLTVLDQQEWETLIPMLRSGYPSRFENTFPSGSDDKSWKEFTQGDNEVTIGWFAPRGIGSTEWTRDEKKRNHILRRFALLGQTADGMRTYDVRRALQAFRQYLSGQESEQNESSPSVSIEGSRTAGIWALYASLFEPEIDTIRLVDAPKSHSDGPYYLNILRHFDIPQAIEMAKELTEVLTPNSK